MKYRLIVSRDCGVSYSQEAQAESVEELVAVAQPLAMWRWYIEDKSGKEADVLCPIHESLIRVIRSLKLELAIREFYQRTYGSVPRIPLRIRQRDDSE